MSQNLEEKLKSIDEELNSKIENISSSVEDIIDTLWPSGDRDIKRM